MTETVIFTLLFMWIIKSYKWSDILKPFKHWTMYPIILTCLIHIYITYLMIYGEYWFIQYSKYIKIISLLFYLGLIWKYKLLNISIFSRIEKNKDKKSILTLITSPPFIGSICIVIGTILNKIAIVVNNFKMPVFLDLSYSTGFSTINMFEKMLQFKDYHVFGNYNSNMIFLTDIFDFGFFTVMSIGDIIIRMFVILILYYSIKQYKEQNIIIDK